MPRQRVESVDLLRGLIMIVMVLDHTRDFFGIPGQNPVDLGSASAGLFLTRWITHFCAPVFFLLTGTGSALSLARKSKAELARFLWTRGLWLIVLEVVVLRCLAYQFNADFKVTVLIVIWALGWAMIVLSLLVRLPLKIILAFGIALMAGHNLFDGVTWDSPLWSVLHRPGFVLNGNGPVVVVAYPLIPWIGVTALGFCLGHIYRWEAVRRQRFLLRLGITLVAGFVLVRGLNIYGDPNPWAPGKDSLYTVLSFLNVSKYPPSLSFLLMTLGPALVLLALLEQGTPSLLRPALAYGKVPLFYYCWHFFLLHLLAVIVCLVRYGSAHWMFESPDIGHYPFTAPPGWGYGLPIVYLVWIGTVLAMYLPCRWFAGVKQRRTDWWLSYL
jgi:uncharacterized membrane protein